MTKWVKWIILILFIILFIYMADYTQIGYDSFLLRPLEASFTEQIGIDSNVNFEHISGLQVKGDIISSLNKNLSVDLENEVILLANGSRKIMLGNLPDSSFGISYINNDKKILYFTDLEKLIVLDENFAIKNSDNITLLDNQGITQDNFVLGYYNEVILGSFGTPSTTYLDVILDTSSFSKGYPVQFTLTRPTKVLILMTIQLEMEIDAGNSATGKAAIVVNNMVQTPEIIVTKVAGTDQLFKTYTTHAIVNFSTGTHSIAIWMKTTDDIISGKSYSIMALSLGK